MAEGTKEVVIIYDTKTKEQLGTADVVDGKFNITVNVDPDSDYAKGDLACAYGVEDLESGVAEVTSDYVDVPAFSTNPIPVNSVLVEPKDNAIKVGDVQALKATIEPSNATEKGVTFESSNPDVAAVTEDGIVTGISAGEAVITATSVSGQETDTASFVVSADDEPAE